MKECIAYVMERMCSMMAAANVAERFVCRLRRWNTWTRIHTPPNAEKFPKFNFNWSDFVYHTVWFHVLNLCSHLPKKSRRLFDGTLQICNVEKTFICVVRLQRTFSIQFFSVKLKKLYLIFSTNGCDTESLFLFSMISVLAVVGCSWILYALNLLLTTFFPVVYALFLAVS